MPACGEDAVLSGCWCAAEQQALQNKLSQKLSERPWTPPLRCVRAGWLPFPPPQRRFTDKTSFSLTTVPLRRFYWVPDSIQQQKQDLHEGTFTEELKPAGADRGRTHVFMFPHVSDMVSASPGRRIRAARWVFNNFLEKETERTRGGRPHYIFQKTESKLKFWTETEAWQSV